MTFNGSISARWIEVAFSTRILTDARGRGEGGRLRYLAHFSPSNALLLVGSHPFVDANQAIDSTGGSPGRSQSTGGRWGMDGAIRSMFEIQLRKQLPGFVPQGTVRKSA